MRRAKEILAMQKTLLANKQNVQRIVSDDYLFRIPGNQRRCVCMTRQADELFGDLRGFMTDQEEVGEMPPYCLRGFLIKPSEKPVIGSRTRDINLPHFAAHSE